MSNEELVTAIQAGHRQYMETLWHQVEKFIKLQADKYLRGYPEHIGAVYRDDLYQSGYLALLDAIRTYQADGGKTFVSWLTYHLRNHFNVTLGRKSTKDKQAPHHYAISLETPLPDTEDATLSDAIIDPDGETAYQEILDAEETKDINQFLMRAIKAMPEDIGAFYLLYFSNGQSRRQAQETLGIPRSMADRLYSKGLVLLRHWMTRHKRERQDIGIDEIVSLGLRGGLRSYRRHHFTSATEIAAMRQLEQWEAEGMVETGRYMAGY